jgi:hypothetical protein
MKKSRRTRQFNQEPAGKRVPARSQRIRTAGAGGANQSSGRSRTTTESPARPRRTTRRGPGDVGKVDATGGGEATVP